VSACLKCAISAAVGADGWIKTIESTVRYLGIEVDDALAIAEQVDV
jgi:HD-like signal output (HDOD) protein